MEGLLDFVLRDILTRVGGVERCVSEFIRVTDTLLPERALLRTVPLAQIFRGVWLFVAALVVALAVVLEFQPLALWLPGFMK